MNGGGPVEWSGEALDAVKNVALSGVAQDFSTYDEGKRLLVYLSPGSTAKAGKAKLEFQTSSGEVLYSEIFVHQTIMSHLFSLTEPSAAATLSHPQPSPRRSRRHRFDLGDRPRFSPYGSLLPRKRGGLRERGGFCTEVWSPGTEVAGERLRRIRVVQRRSAMVIVHRRGSDKVRPAPFAKLQPPDRLARCTVLLLQDLLVSARLFQGHLYRSDLRY